MHLGEFEPQIFAKLKNSSILTRTNRSEWRENMRHAMRIHRNHYIFARKKIFFFFLFFFFFHQGTQTDCSGDRRQPNKGQNDLRIHTVFAKSAQLLIQRRTGRPALGRFVLSQIDANFVEQIGFETQRDELCNRVQTKSKNSTVWKRTNPPKLVILQL